jgi:hypothetical protein
MEMLCCALTVEMLPLAIAVADSQLQLKEKRPHAFIVARHFKSGNVLSAIVTNNIWQGVG